MFLKIIKNAFRLSKQESVKILMYHHVLPASVCKDDAIFVTEENLEKQLLYIKKNYNTVFFKDLETNKSIENKLIITFDDGYYDNLEYLLPLLKKHQLKATIFIPTKPILDTMFEGYKMMSLNDIKNLDPNYIEIALHTHLHQNLAEMNVNEVKIDLEKNIQILEENNIKFTKVLAYPYGRFPKEKIQKTKFFSVLKELGILYALRIGNSLETFPFKNKYEVKRIDIKKQDSLNQFKWKLRLGKLKL